MLDTILDKLDPILAELIIGGIATYATWFGKTFMRSQKSQENLHRALYTGVDYVTDVLASSISGSPDSQQDLREKAVAEIVTYVKGSVPDSVAYLKASDTQIAKMAWSFVNPRLLDMQRSFQ